jgi:hypothetical protein
MPNRNDVRAVSLAENVRERLAESPVDHSNILSRLLGAPVSGDASKCVILSIPSAARPLRLLLLQSFLFVFQHLAYLSDEGHEPRSVLFSGGLFAKLQETFLCIGLHFISQA